MATTVNLSVNVGENKRITFHSGGTYNPEDIVFDVSANGSGYKPLQTAKTSPTASTSTSTSFIDTISQDANGVITATKKTLPTASTTVAGITKVGASGGASAYGHTHNTSIATSTGTNQITLAFGTKYAITAGGTSYVFTMPTNTNDMVAQKLEDLTPDDLWRPILLGCESNSDLDFEGDVNYSYINNNLGFNINSGCVKASGFIVDGSSSFLLADGSIDSNSYALANHTHTGYATSGHTHNTSIATSTGTNQITLAFGTKYAITAGGTSYVFTTPSLPTATSSVAGVAKLGASGGSATYNHTHGSITNDGTITTNTTIASGDHLVITDNSNNNKIKRTSITFGTSTSTYLRNDGTWGNPSAPLASPFFEYDTPGVVIPIAATSNEIYFKDKPTSYDTTPSLLFPTVGSECMALPIFMDKYGRLIMLISDDFANDLVKRYGYSNSPSGKS